MCVLPGVEQLMTLSLRRPVRVVVDAKATVAPRLTQEFIRVKVVESVSRWRTARTDFEGWRGARGWPPP